ncbi:hypothetical protein Tco_1310097 [Tanacetum coccineum]
MNSLLSSSSSPHSIMNSTNASSSNPSKKIKLTIIPPRQLFVNISSDEDITTTPSPTTTSSSPTPPNAPSKTTSTNQTSSNVPPRPLNPQPLQSHPSLDITLSLSPITPLDHIHDTPSPPSQPQPQPPIMGHPLFYNYHDYHGSDSVDLEEDDDWLMAPVTPPRVVSLTRSETPPLLIDPIMLSGYHITTPDFLPWIPPTEPSTYEVGGPSSAVPEAPHSMGRPFSIVASRVTLHHREIGALCMRADKMENMQTRALSLVRKVNGVSDAQVADSIAIAELQPRMTAVEEGVQTLAE